MDRTLIIETSAAAVVVIAVVAMTVAIALLARRGRDLSAEIRRLVDHDVAVVEAHGEQAAATRALAEETRHEHVLAARPLLVLLDEPPIGIRDQPWAAVRVRNVGNGSALNFAVWMLASGNLYRSAGAEAKGFSAALHLASGDIFEPGPFQNMLCVGRAHGYLDPGSAVVGEHPDANLTAYCADQFGNRYRFNLRTADPPDVWERGADAPSWAGAWDPRLSSGAASQNDAHPVISTVPERDLTQLIEALHDVLHALQEDSVPERDVGITGRAIRRAPPSEHRRDFEARS
jgi:hypothetical protein